MIESSYTSDRPDNLLFGHLTPRWVLESLRELDKLAGGNALKGLPVVVSHIKYSLTTRAAAEADAAGARGRQRPRRALRHSRAGQPVALPVTAIDNWGWRARIGLFIVGNEAVPEAEWWAMAPPGVSVHAARVTARAPWARWREDRKAVEPEEDLLRGGRQFAAMRLQAVVVAHSSSSLLGGKGWDEATVASLSPVLGAGPVVTTNGLDTQAALRASG